MWRETEGGRRNGGKIELEQEAGKFGLLEKAISRNKDVGGGKERYQ